VREVRNRVEVSHSAVAHNLACIRRLCADRALIAVVKADAYGLGLERCAQLCQEAGSALIAVAALGEAGQVRAVVPEADVLLLGSPLPSERAAVVAAGYQVCCSGWAELSAFAALSDESRPHPVHVFIDTGMGRAGCAPEEAAELIAAVLAESRLRLAGVASHYPSAVDDQMSSEQEGRFQAVLAAAPDLPADCLVHVANSEGLLCRPAIGNAVRIGLLLSGCVPEGCRDPGLQPALCWRSAVTVVKDLPAGHAVSYGGTVVLKRATRIALVPVGYADGYPFASSGRARVLIGGRLCPVLGRVTMDYLVVDVTEVTPAPQPGDPVLLLGHDAEAVIGVADLAAWAGTIPYDVLCGLRGRCEVVGVA
jgi:alanine racemase